MLPFSCAFSFKAPNGIHLGEVDGQFLSPHLIVSLNRIWRDHSVLWNTSLIWLLHPPDYAQVSPSDYVQYPLLVSPYCPKFWELTCLFKTWSLDVFSIVCTYVNSFSLMGVNTISFTMPLKCEIPVPTCTLDSHIQLTYHFDIFTLMSNRKLSHFCVLMLFSKFGCCCFFSCHTGFMTIPWISQALVLPLLILFSANVTSSRTPSW